MKRESIHLKRVISIIILLSATVCIYADFNSVVNGIEYRFYELTKTASVIGHEFHGTGNPVDIEIPASVTIPCGPDAIPVTFEITDIGHQAFDRCWNLHSIKLPDNIQHIYPSAFHGCTNLVSVDFGKGLKYIDTGAFEDCDALSSLKLPNGLREIRHGAFWHCTKITSVEFGTELELIGFGAFKDSPIPILHFGDKLKVIEEQAFLVATIKSLQLPNSLEEIGDNAFGACYNLESIDFGLGLKKIGVLAFHKSPIRHLKFPDSLERIEDSAFRDNSVIEDIQFGKGLKYIGSNAFAEANLETIQFPDALEVIGGRAFYKSEIRHVSFGNSLHTLGKEIFRNIYYAELPASISYMENTPFSRDKEDRLCILKIDAMTPPVLQTPCMGYPAPKQILVLVPKESIEDYRNNPDWGNFSIQSLDGTSACIYIKAEDMLEDIIQSQTNIIPSEISSLKIIGSFNSSNFDFIRTSMPYCQNFDFRETDLTEIPDNIFSGRRHLMSISLPSSLKSIAPRAFENCYGIQKLDLHNTSIEKIQYYTFNNCYNLSEIILPDCLTAIEQYAFNYCNLFYLNLPESCIDIEPLAFSHNPLFSVNASKSTFSIGNSAFSFCNNLVYISAPGTHTEGADNAFSHELIPNCSIIIPLEAMFHHSGFNMWNRFDCFQSEPMLKCIISDGVDVSIVDQETLATFNQSVSVSLGNENPIAETRCFSNLFNGAGLYSTRADASYILRIVPQRGVNITTIEYDGENITHLLDNEILNLPRLTPGAFLTVSTDYAGINCPYIPSNKLDNNVIYDLLGRPVLNPVPGIYIVNGNKIILK